MRNKEAGLGDESGLPGIDRRLEGAHNLYVHNSSQGH